MWSNTNTHKNVASEEPAVTMTWFLCLGGISIAVIKHNTITNSKLVEGRVNFRFRFIMKGKSGQEFEAEIQRRDPKQKPRSSAASWLAPLGCSICFPTHPRTTCLVVTPLILGFPISIINQENSPTDLPTEQI